MLTLNITLEMQNYIAHPFWPAKNTCIEIEKKSGVNRLRNEDKRLEALKAECKRQGITYKEYLALQKEATAQWYRRSDGMIYIARHQLAGAFVQLIGSAPVALRGKFDKDNFRALVQVGDFDTTLTEPAGVFARFVKLEGSNQRSHQENEYIGVYLDKGEPFTACGVIGVDDEKQVDTVRDLLTAVVERIGIGAARKMGFGRGTVTGFERAA